MIADRGGPGVHHLAHRVENLEAAVAEVQSAGGVLLSSIEQVAGLRQIFVSVAEDSLVHELVQRMGVSGFVGENTAGLVRAESEWGQSPLDEHRQDRLR
jgi:4-hydroxyphenylpyruvate dioxygenase-like putative hemolysin